MNRNLQIVANVQRNFQKKLCAKAHEKRCLSDKTFSCGDCNKSGGKLEKGIHHLNSYNLLIKKNIKKMHL